MQRRGPPAAPKKPCPNCGEGFDSYSQLESHKSKCQGKSVQAESPVDLKKAKALYPYTADGHLELSFSEGEALQIYSQVPPNAVDAVYGEGWTYGNNSKNQKGFFPSNYMEIVVVPKLPPPIPSRGTSAPAPPMQRGTSAPPPSRSTPPPKIPTISKPEPPSSVARCPKCNEGFAAWSKLEVHKFKCISGPPKAIPSEPAFVTHCTKCNEGFDSWSKLDNHKHFKCAPSPSQRGTSAPPTIQKRGTSAPPTIQKRETAVPEIAGYSPAGLPHGTTIANSRKELRDLQKVLVWDEEDSEYSRAEVQFGDKDEKIYLEYHDEGGRHAGRFFLLEESKHMTSQLPLLKFDYEFDYNAYNYSYKPNQSNGPVKSSGSNCFSAKKASPPTRSPPKDPCTLSIYGQNYVDQDWYYCNTCWPDDKNKGICVPCLNYCHEGHDTTYASISGFYCDCGMGEASSSCQCLGNPIPQQKKNITPSYSARDDSPPPRDNSPSPRDDSPPQKSYSAPVKSEPVKTDNRAADAAAAAAAKKNSDDAAAAKKKAEGEAAAKKKADEDKKKNDAAADKKRIADKKIRLTNVAKGCSSGASNILVCTACKLKKGGDTCPGCGAKSAGHTCRSCAKCKDKQGGGGANGSNCIYCAKKGSWGGSGFTGLNLCKECYGLIPSTCVYSVCVSK